jgi:hypothetical protein
VRSRMQNQKIKYFYLIYVFKNGNFELKLEIGYCTAHFLHCTNKSEFFLFIHSLLPHVELTQEVLKYKMLNFYNSIVSSCMSLFNTSIAQNVSAYQINVKYI